MCFSWKYYNYFFLIVVILFMDQVSGRQIAENAEQIFDAARETVNSVASVAQNIAGQAIDVAKVGVTNEIDTVQDAARLAIQTGRNVIEFGENVVLRYLNGVPRS